MAVRGRVYDGAVAAACAADATVGVDRVVIPVVGECDDSWLNDARMVQIEAEDVARALSGATPGTVAEGCVGAGAGMVALDWKASIGTSSRLLPATRRHARRAGARELRLRGRPARRRNPYG